MCSIYNEGKLVVPERFIRTLKTKICKQILQYNTLDDIVNKYDNVYHSAIKMKPASVKNNT